MWGVLGSLKGDGVLYLANEEQKLRGCNLWKAKQSLAAQLNYNSGHLVPNLNVINPLIWNGKIEFRLWNIKVKISPTPLFFF